MRRCAALSCLVALTFALSSCAWISGAPSGNAVVAAKSMEAAKKADPKNHAQEQQDLRKKKQEETVEANAFTEMKDRLEKDKAMAKAYPGRSAHVSKSLFAKEILTTNERIDTISKRVEDLSQRVSRLAGKPETIPEKPADMKVPSKKAPKKITKRTKGAVKSVGPAGKTKRAAAKTAAPFWGVQIGAYKTRPGAETAWDEFLDGPTAIQLIDAKVRYVPSKPLRNGRRLTLIIINKYSSRKNAETECEALKAKNIDCVAYRVNP